MLFRVASIAIIIYSWWSQARPNVITRNIYYYYYTTTALRSWQILHITRTNRRTGKKQNKTQNATADADDENYRTRIELYSSTIYYSSTYSLVPYISYLTKMVCMHKDVHLEAILEQDVEQPGSHAWQGVAEGPR